MRIVPGQRVSSGRVDGAHRGARRRRFLGSGPAPDITPALSQWPASGFPPGLGVRPPRSRTGPLFARPRSGHALTPPPVSSPRAWRRRIRRPNVGDVAWLGGQSDPVPPAGRGAWDGHRRGSAGGFCGGFDARARRHCGRCHRGGRRGDGRCRASSVRSRRRRVGDGEGTRGTTLGSPCGGESGVWSRSATSARRRAHCNAAAR